MPKSGCIRFTLFERRMSSLEGWFSTCVPERKNPQSSTFWKVCAWCHAHFQRSVHVSVSFLSTIYRQNTLINVILRNGRSTFQVWELFPGSRNVGLGIGHVRFLMVLFDGNVGGSIGMLDTECFTSPGLLAQASCIPMAAWPDQITRVALDRLCGSHQDVHHGRVQELNFKI